MVASGNDFVVLKYFPYERAKLASLIKLICNRKYGIGADGLLILEKSKAADIRMRIFNADGSEAEMCGNGARATAYYLKHALNIKKNNFSIETISGNILAEVKNTDVRIKLTTPKSIKLNLPIKINRRLLRVNFVNTGVPHVVIIVEGIENIDVVNLGRSIRFHKLFMPQGTNVNFVEVDEPDVLRVRTYERGVEDETLACGTGSAASALITACLLRLNSGRISVFTKSGEVLIVYFEKKGKSFKNVWLEGRTQIVYSGVINV